MKNITNIRKEVATLANRLNKKLKNLSMSFVKAWKIVKSGLMSFKVVGVTQGNRQEALRRLEYYNKESINITLVREYNNEFDSNAIKVLVSVKSGKSYHLGYIPKDIAFIISALLDNSLELKATLINILGGFNGKPLRGCHLKIELG